MANNKTNIYPVQLQGAELNLNKFDAEIKQYSGFNKNNSPFVGGCLANVFNKDVTIEGSSSKNTYIAPNGDVYKVDTEGLWKNDVLIVSYHGQNNNRFWVQEEITLRDYCVRVFSKDIQLTWEDNKIYLCAFNEKHLIESFFTNANTDEDLNIYSFLTGSFIETNEGEVFFLAVRRLGLNYIIAIDVEDGHKYGDAYGYSFQDYSTDYPISICYNSSYGQLSIFAHRGNNASVDFYTFSKASGFTLLAEDVQEFSASIKSADTNNVWPPLANVRVSSYPFNSGATYKSFTYTSSSSSPSKKIVNSFGNFRYGSDGVYVGNFSRLDIPVISKILSTTGIQDHNIEEGLFTSLLSCFDMQYLLNDGNTSSSNQKFLSVHWNGSSYNLNGVRLVDDVLNGNPFKRGIYAFSDDVKVDENDLVGLKLHLLFNNNQFSGISGVNVLLTDWNNVELKTLSVKNCCEIYYKSNDKWFVIKEGAPELRFINNQVVANKDVQFNSYDVKRNKKLSYAVNFNGLRRTVQTIATLPDMDIENNFWLAAAVNEYNLQDNASIILNPVNLYMFNFSNTINYFSNSGSAIVNIYYTEKTLNDLKYNVSRNIWGVIFKNKKLIGLPFPIDTNGNVMYSPCIFSEIKSSFGNNLLIKNGSSFYPLAIGNDNTPVMSFYLASGIEGLENAFIIQGQYYGVINNQIYTLSFNNGVINSIMFIVNVQGLQFVGNTPYEALFYSKTNRCLYSFTGANVLTQRQLVDKISEVRNYLYNPATQTVFLITDIGVFFYGIFGQFLLEYTDIADIFLLDNGIVMGTDAGLYHYIKYYLDEGDEGYQKNNIELETCFYGMNNEMVTINDCLYFRLFSEEHEEGNLKVSATTISLRGRKTEETTFRIKASDWDKITHSIYLRYQPKEQRGLGVSFSINSPFKIASLSVGSQPEAVLVDKVSKGAVTAPQITSHNVNW